MSELEGQKLDCARVAMFSISEEHATIFCTCAIFVSGRDHAAISRQGVFY